ncbi:MAG: hypothetical protein IPJ19_12910 [Planctomycetes bacterium]|nr:hypothetical protein [Planctomycetota bacterium]
MSLVLPLLLCAALGSEKVELRFAPAEGTKVRRTIVLDQALVMQELKSITPAGVQTSQDQIQITSKQTLRTLDEYRKVADGRPTLLQRRFDAVSWDGTFATGGLKEPIKGVSPLAGTSVVYTWIPEDSDYGKYYDAREAPEEELLFLGEDLELETLLPQLPVAPGDSWEVKPDALLPVLAPCGRLDLRLEAKRARTNLLRALRSGLSGNYGEYFGGESTGQCKATLAVVAGTADHPLAEIELEVTLENRVDQRALQQAQLSGPELANGFLCKSAPVTWNFEGKGKLVWDLHAHRAASLELQGTQKVKMEIELEVRGKPAMTQDMTLAGGLSFDWKIEELQGPSAPQGQK